MISDKNNVWKIKDQIMNYQVKPWDEIHVIVPSITWNNTGIYGRMIYLLLGCLVYVFVSVMYSICCDVLCMYMLSCACICGGGVLIKTCFIASIGLSVWTQPVQECFLIHTTQHGAADLEGPLYIGGHQRRCCRKICQDLRSTADVTWNTGDAW